MSIWPIDKVETERGCVYETVKNNPTLYNVYKI